MAKYLMLWEIDFNRLPDDPKAKKALLLKTQEIVKQHVRERLIKDWGAFAGEHGGYAIFEGSAVDLQTLQLMWVPFVKFTTRELLTIEEVNKGTIALPE